MSRETDSSSSGPNGRGGAAYPSGTPPYGTPSVSENGADTGRSASGNPPEERKTETTLTTRIRINIPGSRPIPPVVVRTPVGDGDASSEGTDGAGTDMEASRAVGPPRSPIAADGFGQPAAQAASAPSAAAAEEKTSDWFAPRKSGGGKGGPGGGSTNGAGLPGGSGAPASSGAPGLSGPSGSSGLPGPQGAGAPGGPGAGGTRPGASGGTNGAGPLGVPGGARPGGANGPRPGGTNAAGLPGATGAGPVAPGHGGGTGSFDVSGALAGTGSFPTIGSDDGGEPRRDDLPYFSDGGGRGPSGPTGGPVTGDSPLTAQPGPGVAPGSLAAGPGGPGAGGPGRGPGYPGGALGSGPGGGLSDDTAILTPQKPAPEPGAGYGGAGDNVSGHTLTSGIPVVPGAQNSPFGPGAHTDGPLPHTPTKLPEPGKQQPAAKKPAKKKGRNKLTLLGVGVVVIGGGAYGAGLLMNHSDVPKGTTVLGVDIGGGTRDEAVKKLEDALGPRTNKPIQLSVDGTTVSLKPDQSGLQLDSKATVSAAATSDYNPVSVIGSLFGQERVVEPVMPVDEEKLQAALQGAAGGSGSMTDGTIKFEPGKAVAVYGKAGKGIDAAQSTAAVEEAYRTQVETGTTTPVKVSTTTRQPTVSNAEVDRMMKKFATPAMSGLVTVRTDAAHTVSFSPARSIYKFLSVQAVNGKLVEHYDLAVLKTLYRGAFDGVTITKGDGSKKPVSPQDVASALGQALRGATPAARIVTISTNPR